MMLVYQHQVTSLTNVGSGKSGTITSSYSGVDLNNYTITDQTTTSADITAKTIGYFRYHGIWFNCQ